MGEEELRRVESALATAEAAVTPSQRYLAAQLAALRVAALVIATRGRPRRAGGRRNAWDLVAHLAPEHAEWAGYFATTQLKQQAIAAGATGLVSEREADDLLRDAGAFRDEVVGRLARAARSRRTG
ncbi:MAG: SAV_6107 family HEPN domain-containing protein [Propionicimonas sp.]|nr:SAV_6107 family HEPN domain-containing protein [Propionicimonas sp.]